MRLCCKTSILLLPLRAHLLGIGSIGALKFFLPTMICRNQINKRENQVEKLRMLQNDSVKPGTKGKNQARTARAVRALSVAAALKNDRLHSTPPPRARSRGRF
jgi:hypothetical protein